jgi:hypothetical protein
MMDRVLAQVRQAGFEASGVFTDPEAIHLIESGNFDVIVIGGGVEAESREKFKAVSRHKSPNPEVLEIFGPGTLLPKLLDLKRKVIN